MLELYNELSPFILIGNMYLMYYFGMKAIEYDRLTNNQSDEPGEDIYS